MNFLPLKGSAAEATTADRFIQPICGGVNFLTAHKNTIVLTAELVGDGRIFLVDQVSVIVLEFKLVVHIRNQLKIHNTN